MTITIYNTLTRDKEVFKPLVDHEVSMYVCGPTVYNYIHIGNARPAIVFDTVRRYFEYKGYTVNYVLNFTDVDDKIIAVMKETGESIESLTNRFIEAYLEDVSALGVKKATYHPRVTETIEDIITFIQGLIVMVSYPHSLLTNCAPVPGFKSVRIKKIHWTLPFGKRQRTTKLLGKHHGARDAQDGISNVQRWRRNI